MMRVRGRVNPDWEVSYCCFPKGDEKLLELELNILGSSICFDSSKNCSPGEMTAVRMHDRNNFYADDLIASAKVVRCEKSSSNSYVYVIEAEIFWMGWNNRQTQEKIAGRLREILG